MQSLSSFFDPVNDCGMSLEFEYSGDRTIGGIRIIAIVADLLLPSLRAAKTQAQRVQCLSQLQQFSYAGSVYVDDPQPEGVRRRVRTMKTRV
jgi:hypothetical protein